VNYYIKTEKAENEADLMAAVSKRLSITMETTMSHDDCSHHLSCKHVMIESRAVSLM